MTIERIPNAVMTYPDGTEPPRLELSDELMYEPTEGELVRVSLWARYPDYDFVFGIPHESSPRFEKEAGFFAFRDSRGGHKTYGHYFDVSECMAVLNGFQKILSDCRERQPHLWKRTK